MGEVRVLLSYADIYPSIRGMEGANQESSIGVYNAIVQPDLEKMQIKSTKVLS